jgi:hypothetical protein
MVTRQRRQAQQTVHNQDPSAFFHHFRQRSNLLTWNFLTNFLAGGRSRWRKIDVSAVSFHLVGQ